MKNSPITKCPVCGQGSLERKPGKARDNENLFPYKCADCGFTRLLTSKGERDMAVDFSAGNWNGLNKEANMKALKGAQAEASQWYNDFQAFISGKKVLDYASGSGQFLAHAQVSASKVTGIDLDRSHSAFYESKNIPFHKSLDELPVDEKFDFITIFHALDHMDEPVAVLKELKERLTDEGRLLIETPNADDALLTTYACESFANFTYYQSHCCLYTFKSLGLLLDQAGFDYTLTGK